MVKGKFNKAKKRGKYPCEYEAKQLISKWTAFGQYYSDN